jgi:hypothetical protein
MKKKKPHPNNPPDIFEPFEGGVRWSDPDTSWQAAFRDLQRRAGDRLRALQIHYTKPQGLTDYELAERMIRQQNSAGKRRGELRDLGLIEESPNRRPAPSGSPTIVWVITENGRRVYQELNKQST